MVRKTAGQMTVARTSVVERQQGMRALWGQQSTALSEEATATQLGCLLPAGERATAPSPSRFQELHPWFSA